MFKPRILTLAISFCYFSVAMRNCSLLLFSLMIASRITVAQSGAADALQTDREYDSLLQSAKLNRYADSLKILTWGDSMRMKVNATFAKNRSALSHSPDSLEKLTLRISALKRKTDSLVKVTNPSSKAFALLKSRQDSLKKLKRPSTKFTRQMDKAAEKQQKMLRELNTKQNVLSQKVNGRYAKWESSVRSKLKLDSFGVKGTGNIAGLKRINAPVTGTQLPGAKLPGLNEHFPSGLPKISNLNSGDFSNLRLSKELSGLGGNLSVPSMGQLNQWEKSIPGLSNNPIKNVSQQISGAGAVLKDPSKAAENAVGQIGDVQTLNKEVAAANNLKAGNEALKIANGMKDTNAMKAEAQKQAVNHFAGKEEVLKKSMDAMAKYKKKYHSLNSLADAKKLKWWQPVNSLKGKPFGERIHPGVNLGYSTRKDTLNLDFYPNVSYQISGRFEAGLGALYRVHINMKTVAIDQRQPVWGLTAFTTFKLFKSTHFRLEADAISSMTPSGSNDGTLQRSWRWQAIMGVQNNFKISKLVTGNVQMLYNFDKSLKDGFPERLMVRVGVAFRLKKKS
jgi:hypothetical protein